MPKIKYSKDQLIKYFRPRPIESLQNANYVNCLQLNGQLIKVSTQFPVNYYKDELVIKGFNQGCFVVSHRVNRNIGLLGQHSSCHEVRRGARPGS